MKVWDAFFIEIQYRNTVKKRPAFCGPNKKKLPAGYEPATYALLMRCSTSWATEAYQALYADSYIIYGIPGFGKCFLEKSEINIFLEKLEKSSWQSGGSGVLYSLSPMKLIELFEQFKQLQLLNLSKKDKKVVDKQKKLW